MAWWKAQFAQRVPSVDEHLPLWCERVCDPVKADLSGFRMPPVESADSDCKSQVKGVIVRQELEVLHGDLTHAHETGRDLIGTDRP